MTWRSWTPLHTEPNGACGDRGDDGPSARGPSKTLRSLIKERQMGGECAAAIGPFPFADGSLQALSSDNVRALARSPITVNFSRAHLSRTTEPFWTHEDAGIGYLLYHTAIMQGLPLTFVVLSSWRHNKFWINWFPPKHPSLPDEHVVNTHKIVTPIMAQIALDAYENTTYSEDPIVCVDCTAKWGWSCCHDSPYGRVPIEKFACCNKEL